MVLRASRPLAPGRVWAAQGLGADDDAKGSRLLVHACDDRCGHPGRVTGSEAVGGVQPAQGARAEVSYAANRWASWALA